MEAVPATTPSTAPATAYDCCVKVSVHIRPLIGDEKLQGCDDCVVVVPGKPQVQLGTHSFTFDHVYGSTGSPSSVMFEECASPLVDGLFQGYNATVLAFGQTGSGKTYTMGTGFKNGYQTGLIPQAMNALFNKIESLQHQVEFQLHVSFIELHLVDLAGSERAKRTGSDGMRFKEGIHINKGLLALGNVISALGDEKKRKEGAHVPYRDSKLTRLLQVSLGGNSRTVMIACVSPADINAEETLNTLKYANRARNIQNKPVVNRDPVSNEMLTMRQQLEFLQAELCARGGNSSAELENLRERISWLEATNQDLRRELHEYRMRGVAIDQSEMVSANVGDSFFMKNERLKRGLQSVDSSDYPMNESGDSGAIVEEAANELEHTLRQDSMDKELHELNTWLQQKESEMRLFEGCDTMTLKQHFGKKLTELEEEKQAVQIERDRLLTEVENLSASSDCQTQKLQELHSYKLKSLESQVREETRNQVQLSRQKQKSDEAAKRLQDEIQFIKAQKVQLQHKIKQEAEQFRLWKASREKELLQLKKEGRRNEYERHKLQALNQRQKMVLQRKTEEAAMATKRLKELLETRKYSRENSATSNGNGANGQNNEKSLQRWLDHELEVMVNVHEVRHEYKKQNQMYLAVLRQAYEFASKGASPPRGKNAFPRACSLSPNARMARISSLENMLSVSSNSLVSMASQLSEAEERERAFASRGRWNHLRSMADAKKLLQYMFNSLAHARCQLLEKDLHMKEMEEQFIGILRQSELRRKEIGKELKAREQAVAVTLASSPSVNSYNSLKHVADEMSDPLSPSSVPAPKQLKYTAGIANGSVRESAGFLDHKQKMVPVGQFALKKSPLVGNSPGKLWRWKRSHHQWLLQFKWKWQKPWRLSELIRHSDETVMRSKPLSQALPEVMYHHRRH
ncbi:hypothetical protein E3N88_44876 [Mikania micrantha]|uniref:Kinesin motor domain-containing protein n=1 Tax=Mikania micrantha TaxID=192012 RepID=A0A5N6LD39_9ASTR|nr:hypothetical protein E3N88_44876 [Mikania micrantha]